MEEDIYKRKNWYKAELKRLKKARISNRNKEIIKRFHTYLFSVGASEPRVVKLSWQLRILAHLLNKDFDKTNEKDIRNIVAEINKKENISEATKGDYRRVLKQFYKWLEGKGKIYPEKVGWIKCKIKNNNQENKDLITAAEIRKVIEKCENDRDRAFISLLYESGARIGEVLGMKIRDFKNYNNYGKVNVTGKTGPRGILVVSSVPYINKHLDIHPFRSDSNAYFWLSIGSYNHNKRLMYIGAKRIIDRAFKRASIKKKRLYLHLFRHSRATELASYLTEAQMKKYFGWVQGSDMASVYVHMSGRDIDNGILSYYGLKGKEENNEEKLNTNLVCYRCKTVNPANGKFCTNCGLALNIKVALESEERMKEETNKTIQVLKEIMRNPELLKKFEEF